MVGCRDGEYTFHLPLPNSGMEIHVLLPLPVTMHRQFQYSSPCDVLSPITFILGSVGADLHIEAA